jgi:hypothetical protein
MEARALPGRVVLAGAAGIPHPVFQQFEPAENYIALPTNLATDSP